MPDDNTPETDASAADSGLPRLVLKPREERRLHAGHLWIFSNEVDVEASPLSSFAPGQVAAVFSSKDRFLGYASVNPHTLIAGRLLSRGASEKPGRAWLARRLEAAKALRERFFERPFYRLAFGESDQLPGLVVDRYGDVCVVQLGTAGMEAMKDEVLAALCKVVAPSAVLWRNDSPLRELEGLPLYVEAALGDVPDSVEVEEGGVRFSVPLAEGQKTGWFFDQAPSRAAVARHSAGARVLDVFSYAGGFGLQAARAGAREVTCVDASAAALSSVEATAAANGLSVATARGDAFEVLEGMARERRRFDVVVVDPPAFIKRRKDHGKGLAAYKRINQLALQLLDRDGLLMSCSCSSHLAEGELIDVVQRGARHVDRFVQLVSSGGQAPDHPVHPAIPETRYLKALLFRVTHT